MPLYFLVVFYMRKKNIPEIKVIKGYAHHGLSEAAAKYIN